MQKMKFTAADMKRTRRIAREQCAASIYTLNRTRAQFLILDAQVAQTFLDVADTTLDSNRAKVAIEHARVARDTIGRLKRGLVVDQELHGAIDEAYEKLQRRLSTIDLATEREIR